MYRHLLDSATGRVGLVVGREGGDRGFSQIALDAYRNEELLILTLDDLDLFQMVELKRAGKRIEAYLEAKIGALCVASTERGESRGKLKSPQHGRCL